jgi:hypothetical protein
MNLVSTFEGNTTSGAVTLKSVFIDTVTDAVAYEGNIEAHELPDGLQALPKPKILRMAMILHIADVATSAGLTLERTRIETDLLTQETGLPILKEPNSIREFITEANLSLLPVGQVVYGHNPESIRHALQSPLPAFSPTPPVVSTRSL